MREMRENMYCAKISTFTVVGMALRGIDPPETERINHLRTLLPQEPGGRLHIKFARMCALTIEKYTHFEGLLEN